MDDYEEDLNDFPAVNREKPAESKVGSYRAESTDQKNNNHNEDSTFL